MSNHSEEVPDPLEYLKALERQADEDVFDYLERLGDHTDKLLDQAEAAWQLAESVKPAVISAAKRASKPAKNDAAGWSAIYLNHIAVFLELQIDALAHRIEGLTAISEVLFESVTDLATSYEEHLTKLHGLDK